MDATLRKVTAGCYRVAVDGRPVGTVDLDVDTREWVATWKGCLVGYGRTRAEAVQELLFRAAQRAG